MTAIIAETWNSETDEFEICQHFDSLEAFYAGAFGLKRGALKKVLRVIIPDSIKLTPEQIK